jgi:type II secretory pathway pseudopilin PulG
MTKPFSTDTNAPAASSRRGERGYALIALLALMTVLMITMMAAASSIRQQTRRELELETIARGEEVAEAIRTYIHYKNQPPTSMDDLLEGVAPPGRTKKIQVLRASAARDPLSTNGEWRLIKVNDQAFAGFVKALTDYAAGRLPNAVGTDAHPSMAAIANTLPRINSIVTGLDSEGTSGGDDEPLTSRGPFVGVASSSNRKSIVTYYGIERHNGWVFTPFYR